MYSPQITMTLIHNVIVTDILYKTVSEKQINFYWNAFLLILLTQSSPLDFHAVQI